MILRYTVWHIVFRGCSDYSTLGTRSNHDCYIWE